MHTEDGAVLRLYSQTMADFGICVGRELTAEQENDLRSAASRMSAKMRAVRIVSATGVSKKDLEHRLIQKGEDPTEAKNAVAWMADMDLLDDEKLAHQVVSQCVAKGYGKARAKQALYEKRIPKEYWDDALEDYPDQMEYILKFLRSRLGDDPDEKQIRRTVDALLRRGHTYGQIKRGLERLSLESDFPEEI